VKNKDNKCFKYAILTKYNKCAHKNIMNIKNFNFLEKKSGLNFNCIDFPTSIKQVKKFERTNNVSINIFSKDEKNLIYPLHVCTKEKKIILIYLFSGTINGYIFAILIIFPD
jgi:hypothetical protein